MPTTKRKRRSPEEMIQDLQAEIERIREDAKAKASPAHKQVKAALRSLTKAQSFAAEEGDADLEKAIERSIDALAAGTGRATSSSGRTRRSPEELEAFSAAIWDTLAERPGLSISALAAALETTSKDVRGPLKGLMDAGHVRKKGERRGTQYFTKGKQRPETFTD